MSSNFYNEAGHMAGIDIHTSYIAAVPAPVVTGHIVAVPFTHQLNDIEALVGSVTSQGQRMFQEGAAFALVPHIPIPLGPPCPARELIEYASIIAFSSSKAVLAVRSVTGRGKPLAVCVSGDTGTNENCNVPVDLPTDCTTNPNTVMTTPTGADFARAAAHIVIDAAVSALLGKLLEKALGKVIEKLVERLFPRLAQPIKKFVEEKINETIEEVLDKVLSPADKAKRPILSRLHAVVA